MWGTIRAVCGGLGGIGLAMSAVKAPDAGENLKSYWTAFWGAPWWAEVLVCLFVLLIIVALIPEETVMGWKKQFYKRQTPKQKTPPTSALPPMVVVDGMSKIGKLIMDDNKGSGTGEILKVDGESQIGDAELHRNETDGDGEKK